MATKTENAEIAVLQTQMTEVKESLNGLKDNLNTGLTQLSAKIDGLSSVPLVVTSLEKRITVLEKALNRNWLKMTGSGIVGALLLYLAQYALTHQ